MKKQFWADLVIILLSLSLISCASIRKCDETTVNTALNLANKQIEMSCYDDALETYNKALSKGNDYNLIYNKALLLAKMDRIDDAIDTANYGYKIYKNKDEFLILLAHFNIMSEKPEEFINMFEAYLTLHDDNKVRIQYMQLCFEHNLFDEAYNQALVLIDKGVYQKENISVLFEINPEEWQILHEIIN